MRRKKWKNIKKKLRNWYLKYFISGFHVFGKKEKRMPIRKV